MLLIYIVSAISLLQFQLLNMAIPGRFSHLVVTLLLMSIVLFTVNAWTKLEKDLLKVTVILLVYGAIVTLCGFLYHLIFKIGYFSLSDAAVSLIYFTLFVVSPSIIFCFMGKLRLAPLCYLVVAIHLFTIVVAILQIFDAFPQSSILNSSETHVLGRIAILDKEPSVASYRLFFLLWIVCFIRVSLLSNSISKRVMDLLGLSFSLLTIFAIIYVRSKLVIFVVPVAIFLALVSYSLIKNKVSYFKMSLLIPPLAFIAYQVTQTEYFNYAYTYTFVYSDGSFSTRALAAIESMRLFISVPFGTGMSYPLYLLDYIKSSSLLDTFYNSEIQSYLNTVGYNTIISPKSFLLTCMLILGFPFVVILFKVFENLVFLSKDTRSLFPNLCFFWFSMLYITVSDFNIQPLLYFSLFMVVINAYAKRKEDCI